MNTFVNDRALEIDFYTPLAGSAQPGVENAPCMRHQTQNHGLLRGFIYKNPNKIQKSVIHFKNNNFQIIYAYNANNEYFSILQKNDPYCEKWIICNV